jgi:hypothetical protein
MVFSLMIEALAALAAGAVVQAMATDAWVSARDGIARLFGRQGRDRGAAIRTQLDNNEALVARAPDPDEARKRLAGLWQAELEGLLRDDAGAAEALQTLVDEIRAQLPPAQQNWTQHITAAGSGSVAGGAIGGNVNYNFPGPPPVADDLS